MKTLKKVNKIISLLLPLVVNITIVLYIILLAVGKYNYNKPIETDQLIILVILLLLSGKTDSLIEIGYKKKG